MLSAQWDSQPGIPVGKSKHVRKKVFRHNRKKAFMLTFKNALSETVGFRRMKETRMRKIVETTVESQETSQ
jgi:hypothetical protein